MKCIIYCTEIPLLLKMMPELIDLFVPYRYKFKELRRGITRALQFTTIHEQHHRTPTCCVSCPNKLSAARWGRPGKHRNPTNDCLGRFTVKFWTIHTIVLASCTYCRVSRLCEYISSGRRNLSLAKKYGQTNTDDD